MRTQEISQGCNHEPFVAELLPGKVVGDCLLVANTEDQVIGGIQALHGVEEPSRHWVLRRCRYRSRTSLPGTAVLLAAASGSNYYHWLLESLPRLFLLQQAGFDWDQFDYFLVNEHQQLFHAQTLDVLGIPVEKRFRARKACVLSCERLVLPSLPGPPMVFPQWALAFLRREFLRLSGVTQKRRRLFVSRRHAKRRRLLNETELEPYFKDAGFEVVALEDYSFTEQVSLFASASAIVAAHGAGLANLVFAQSETVVVELVAPTFINHCYEKLSSALDLKYHEVVGLLGKVTSKRCEEDDFFVPLRMLQEALRAAGLLISGQRK